MATAMAAGMVAIVTAATVIVSRQPSLVAPGRYSY